MTHPSRRKFAHRLIDAAAVAPAERLGAVVGDTREMRRGRGELTPGGGMVTTAIALSLVILGALGVVAFHYPQHLTTPELRVKYAVDAWREALLSALLIAGAPSLGNLILNRQRNISIASLVLVVAAVALGGSRVPAGNFPDHTPYIGLDQFILDLLGSTLIFVVIAVDKNYAAHNAFIDTLLVRR